MIRRLVCPDVNFPAGLSDARVIHACKADLASPVRLAGETRNGFACVTKACVCEGRGMEARGHLCFRVAQVTRNTQRCYLEDSMRTHPCGGARLAVQTALLSPAPSCRAGPGSQGDDVSVAISLDEETNLVAVRGYQGGGGRHIAAWLPHCCIM
ncbi:hypothetical protein E2C01_092394 [Portunus trituberculatus]|uniref:Uncharacterized protein n=1 Tax=Portunus trituberculatus TaxID=210409 RepID=A0A5B7JGC3_PORTR|nr:hypothetical protein [Portunus trituberculatus]